MKDLFVLERFHKNGDAGEIIGPFQGRDQAEVYAARNGLKLAKINPDPDRDQPKDCYVVIALVTPKGYER